MTSKISIENYFKNGYALVVEDENTLRKAIRDMLRMLKIEHVIVAEDGDVALQILKEKNHPRRTAVPEKARQNCLFVFLDWYMPRMPGIDVALEIRADKELENIPLLMVTAERRQDRIVEAIAEVGVNGYIIKPFRARDLEEKIFTILKHRNNPTDYEKLIVAGEKLMKEGKLDEALFLFNRAAEIKFVSARIHVLMGEAYREKGEWTEARRFFGQAMKDNPRYLKSYVDLADLFLKEGKKDMALSPLKKAAKISPRNAERQTVLGKIHLDLGQEEEAKKVFEEALKLDPSKAKAVAEAYLERDDAEKAEMYFRLALPKEGAALTEEEKKGWAHTVNRLGIALRKQGKSREAVEEYKKALAFAPADEAVWFNLGKAYIILSAEEKTREYREEAMKCFQKAVELSPAFEEAREELRKLCPH